MVKLRGVNLYHLKGVTYNKILLLIVFLLFLLVLRWNSFSMPLERDEGEYAYSAWLLKEGRMPYEDSFLQKPPLIIYTYALGQLISEDGLWPPRLLAFLSLVLTAFLVYLIGRREFSEKAGWIGAFLFAVLASSPINASLAANTEIFMLLPLTAFLWLFLSRRKEFHLGIWFASGVLSSLALLYKPIALDVILYIYFLWLWNIWKEKKELKLIIEFFGVVVTAHFLTFFLLLLPFLISDGGRAFWEQVIIFNLFYAKQWGYSLSAFFWNLKMMWPSFWPVFLLVLTYPFLKLKNWRFYSGLILFSLLAVYQVNIRHYYLLLMPFLALILAQEIVHISEMTWVKRVLKSQPTFWLTLTILFLIIWPVGEQITKTPEELSLWIYGQNNPFFESLAVAKKVAAVTNPEDCIFVAGSEPQIYFYAKRFSCSKFVITYPLIIETPWREKYQKEAVLELEKKKPIVILPMRRK